MSAATSTELNGKSAEAKVSKAKAPKATKKVSKGDGKVKSAKSNGKAKATKPVAKKATAKIERSPSGTGIGDYACELLTTEPDVNVVLAAVLKKFPNAKTSKASIYWYRAQMTAANK